MKIYQLALGLAAVAAVTLTSCRSNDYPSFSDAEAFVAMQSSSTLVGEKDGSIEIPVMLTSLSGMDKTVTFEFIPDSVAGAVEGVNYTLVGDKSLTFTKDEPVQYITLNILDNDSYDGNVKFTISLVQPEGLNLGANSDCVVTIRDDEHPLAMVLGTYSASADSYFASRGHFDWDITISSDESDDTKVWIANIDPYFAKYGYVAPNYNYFYGFANEDKTAILIPVEQELGYDNTVLVGFPLGVTLADADNTMESGESITLSIQDGGAKLVFENAIGIYDDGWWNLFDIGVTLNKK